MGSSPKRLKVFFYVIITWRFILFFSVYGTKWWTDNLKSRQVERVLTKFKGCEPSCRKVQKVAALVGSGGVTIYICVCVYVVHPNFINQHHHQTSKHDLRPTTSPPTNGALPRASTWLGRVPGPGRNAPCSPCGLMIEGIVGDYTYQYIGDCTDYIDIYF